MAKLRDAHLVMPSARTKRTPLFPDLWQPPPGPVKYPNTMSAYDDDDRFPLDAICADLAAGATFASVALDYIVDEMTLRRWLLANPERARRYNDAREMRGHHLFDELDETIEEAMLCRDKVQIQAFKLKIDTLKWKIAKLAPQYSDKQQVELSGSVETRSDDQIQARLEALLAKAAKL